MFVDLQLLAYKRYQFQYNILTSNHMFGSGDFWDKSPLLLLVQYQNFKKCARAISLKLPSKHVITSTNGSAKTVLIVLKICLGKLPWKFVSN